MSDTPPVIIEDDPKNTPPPPDGIVVAVEPEPKPPGQTFTAEDIEKARQQEKDKLYPDLQREREAREAMEARLATIEVDRQAAADAAAVAQREADEAQRRAAEEEMSVRELLQTKEQEWTQLLGAERAERERLAATLQLEQQFQQLQAYRLQQIEANSDHLMPELRDLIAGSTAEEIDASVALVRDKTAAIMTQVQQAQVQQRQQQRGVQPTGAPPAGPLEQGDGTRTFSNDDLKGMSVEEYAKNRHLLLPALSRQVQDKGLYS